MANITKLQLLNGEEVSIQLGYNPMKCMIIARDFPEVNEVFSFAVNSKGDTQSIEFKNMAAAVYVAYRQANMKNYLTFEEFFDEEDGLLFDLAEAGQIYTAMLDPKAADKYIQAVSKLGKAKGKKA